MNRDELILGIMESCAHGPRAHYRPKLIKADVAAVLHHLGNVVLADLLAGGSVTLPGLGRFSARKTKDKGRLFVVFDFGSEAEQAVRAQGGEVAK